MICLLCRKAADDPADASGTGHVHPKKCDCTCQHRPPGAWKGEADED